MNPRLLVFAALVLLAGCVTPPSPTPPAPAPAPAEAVATTQETFVPLDQAARDAVICPAQQARVLADGRLEVAADLRNRAGHAIEVQIQCVFKDAAGFLINDSTPWRKLSLADGATETVRFTARDGRAVRYAICVRK